jgi:hypothetical protein
LKGLSILEGTSRKMSDTTASIKIIPFSGKKADWTAWSEKFLARARRRGYKEYLEGTERIPTDAEKPADTETATVKEVYKGKRDLNELAYEDLVLCIDTTTPDGRVAFACVRGSKTNDIKGVGTAQSHGKDYRTSLSLKQLHPV